MRRVLGLPAEWTVDTVLLADIFHALAGKQHPQRSKAARAAKASRTDDARQRLLTQRARASRRG